MQAKNIPKRVSPEETIGRRIARLRQDYGWTQQSLATRLAISRVAISHIEMDLTLPSERTITLLAGLFKCTPYTLVESTTYPPAKTERLPEVVCCYTQLEMELALMRNDLEWLIRLEGSWDEQKIREEVQSKWRKRLLFWRKNSFEARERAMITAGLKELNAAFNKPA